MDTIYNQERRKEGERVIGRAKDVKTGRKWLILEDSTTGTTRLLRTDVYIDDTGRESSKPKIVKDWIKDG